VHDGNDDSDDDPDEDEENDEQQDTPIETRIDSPVASPHSSSQTITPGSQYSALSSFGHPLQFSALPSVNHAITAPSYALRFPAPSSSNVPYSSAPQSSAPRSSSLQANQLQSFGPNSAQSFASQPFAYTTSTPGTSSRAPTRTTLASLPNDVQANLGYQPRRFIQTDLDNDDKEPLDASKMIRPGPSLILILTGYRRVAINHQRYFFVPGRVRLANAFSSITHILANTVHRFLSYSGQSLPARPILGRHETRHILAQYVLENKPTAKSAAS
jgi:hypothetical protein